MKAIFLTLLSVFALFAFSTAGDLIIRTPKKTQPGTTDVALPTSQRELLTTNIPSKLVGVTSKLILFNVKMRSRFEDGTIVHSKYQKRIRALSRRAQKLTLEDMDDSVDDDESDDEEESGLNVATRKVGQDSLKLSVTTRNACARCNSSCAGAAAACKVGCYFTGPAGVVECEVAWAGVSAGCFTVCATKFC